MLARVYRKWRWLLGIMLVMAVPGIAVRAETLGPVETRLEALYAQTTPYKHEEELSLVNSLKAQALAGTEREQIVWWYGYCAAYSEPTHKPLAEAFAAAEQLDNLAKRYDSKVALAYAALCRSYSYSALEKIPEALAQSQQAFALANQVTDDGRLYFRVGNFYGLIAQRAEKLDEALTAFRMALLGSQALADKRRQATMSGRLAVVHYVMKQYPEALQLYDHELELSQQIGNLDIQGSALRGRAEIFVMQNRLDEAQTEYGKALELAVSLQSTAEQNSILVNLSDIALRRRQFVEAERLATEIKARAAVSEDWATVAVAEANIGFALAGQKHIELAIPHLKHAFSYFQKQNSLSDEADLHEEWSRALAENGRYQEALNEYKRYTELTGQVQKNIRTEAVLKLQQQMDTEKKEKEIELLNKENALQTADIENRKLTQRLWWLVAGIATLVLIVVLQLYGKMRHANRQLAEKNKELDFQSTRDPLTALYNRRYFQQLISSVDLQHERRAPGQAEEITRALYLIDIDHFKRINDGHGHAAGDVVLVEVAERLRKGLRDHDVIVRWGGEEFLIFAQQLPLAMVKPLAQRILDLFASSAIDFEDIKIPVSASVGYCLLPISARGQLVDMGWERAINIVDMALYMAKAHGRNRAYGVVGLNGDAAEILPRIEKDLEQTWQAGLVELDKLEGPPLPT